MTLRFLRIHFAIITAFALLATGSDTFAQGETRGANGRPAPAPEAAGGSPVWQQLFDPGKSPETANKNLMTQYMSSGSKLRFQQSPAWLMIGGQRVDASHMRLDAGRALAVACQNAGSGGPAAGTQIRPGQQQQQQDPNEPFREMCNNMETAGNAANVAGKAFGIPSWAIVCLQATISNPPETRAHAGPVAPPVQSSPLSRAEEEANKKGMERSEKLVRNVLGVPPAAGAGGGSDPNAQREVRGPANTALGLAQKMRLTVLALEKGIMGGNNAVGSARQFSGADYFDTIRLIALVEAPGGGLEEAKRALQGANGDMKNIQIPPEAQPFVNAVIACHDRTATTREINGVTHDRAIAPQGNQSGRPQAQ